MMNDFLTNYMNLCAYACSFCIFIPLGVLFIMMLLVTGPGGTVSGNSESKFLELIWTIGPTLVVFALCYFNVSSVGLMAPDDITRAVKVTGRQWYWSYEIGTDPSYDSMMLSFIDSVDKPLRLEGGHAYQLTVTSSDVIHSFALPDLFVKIDAVPGRINQFFFKTPYFGTFVGYCSELCGAGHAYMPIVAEVVQSPEAQ